MHAYCLTRGLLFGVVPFGLVWTFAPSADPNCLGHAHQVHTALVLLIAVLNGLNACARARLPPELAEEVRRLLVGEASLGRPVRRRAMAALRAALCEHPAREPARRAA